MAEIIRIDGIKTLRSLDRMGVMFANPKPLLMLIANELMRVARASFEKRQSPDGVPWRLLSSKYARWKSKRWPAHAEGRTANLYMSGQLIRSLRSGVEERSAWVTAGPLEHAAVHQYGFQGNVAVPAHTRKVKSRDAYRKSGSWTTSGEVTKFKTKKILRSMGVTQVKAFSRRMSMPARPYLGFPPESRERVTQDIKDEILRRYEGQK